MKVSELIKHLADCLVLDGDVDVYLYAEDHGPREEELIEEVIVGRKRVLITSKDFS